MADGTITYQLVIDDKGAIKSINQVSDAAKQAGADGATGFDGIAASIGRVAQIIATSAIVAKILDIGKAAISAYSDFEQLRGGAQLMFGDAYDYVADKAANAYATVQMSQNEYLRQVNGFSVGLRESLGGDSQAAAELADRIVTAEADLVAATGNTAESVQNAFNGIMKGNYMMLDNLQLGIKPTKEGLQEVIDKVNEWNATASDRTATDYTIDNLADCEAALVDYVEMMGMANYATNEAKDTLQGSSAMMAAAWENLLVGMADETADKTQLIKNLLESVKTYFGNLMPVIKELINSFIESLPDMLNAILDMALALIDDISANLPTLIENLTQCLIELVQAVIDHIPQILAAGVKLIIGLGQGLIKAIPQLIANIPTIILSLFNALVNGVGSMIQAGMELLFGAKKGAEDGGRQLTSWFSSLPSKILSALGSVGNLLYNAGSSIINGLLSGLKNAFSGVKDFVSGIGSWIAEHKGPEQYDKTLLLKQGGWIMESLATGLRDGRSEVMDALSDITADIQGYTVDAQLSPQSQAGVFNNSTIVNINGISTSSPSVIEAAGNLVSALQLDIRMGVA